MSRNKNIMTAVALAAALAGASSIASAQTSGTQVTLYGILDANVQVLDGNGTLTRLQSGGLQGSRFGLRGTEDLGGGLRAFFTLESGINLDEGTNGQGAFWGRQAFVGLGTPYGQISVGRQYGSIYTLSSDFSQFANTSSGASTAVIGGFGGYEPVRGSDASGALNGGPARVNNSVKLESIDYNGFKAGALVGLGEVAGGTKQTRVADIYGRYTQGGIDAMLSYVSDKKAASGLDVQTLSAAGAYRFDAFRVLVGVISVDDRTVANLDGNGYWLGGDYSLGRHTFKTQYVQSKLKHGPEGKTQALGVGYQYDLSKRTALYSSLTRFKNEGVGYAPRIAGTVPTGLLSGGERNITEFVGGIRHSF
jgi:predicted porin